MTADYPARRNEGFQQLSTLGDDMAAAVAIDANGAGAAGDSRFDDVLMSLARRGWVNSIVAWMQAHPSGNINARSLLSGRTALQEAVANGKIRAVEILLAMGANPLATDNQGFTAVHDACWACRNEWGHDADTMIVAVTACAVAACRLGAGVDAWDADDPNRPWICSTPRLQEAMRDAWLAGFMDEKTPQAEDCGVGATRRL